MLPVFCVLFAPFSATLFYHAWTSGNAWTVRLDMDTQFTQLHRSQSSREPLLQARVIAQLRLCRDMTCMRPRRVTHCQLGGPKLTCIQKEATTIFI